MRNRRLYHLKLDSHWIDSVYRYRLDAEIDSVTQSRLVVIQINPSKAGSGKFRQLKSDATVGKVCNWAYRKSFSQVSFLNLFAFIATPQDDLRGQPYDLLVGPRNDEFIATTVVKASTVIVAWGEPLGVSPSDYCRRLSEVKSLVTGIQLFTVGPLIKGRYPRHGRVWNAPHSDDLRVVSWSDF
jgi:hypothetical protein